MTKALKSSMLALRPTGSKIAIVSSIVIALWYLWSYDRAVPEDTFLGGMEARLQDVKMKLRGPLEPSGNVAVIAIDERSVKSVGRWPWPRRVMADLIDGLTVAGARVIALDMAFADPVPSERERLILEVGARYHSELEGLREEQLVADVSMPGFEAWLAEQEGRLGDDEYLAKVIFESGRVVSGLFPRNVLPHDVSRAAVEDDLRLLRPFMVHGIYRDAGGREVPDPRSVADPSLRIAELRGVETPVDVVSNATPFFGTINVEIDPDGVVRNAFVLERLDDALVPSFALASVAAWLGSDIYPMLDDLHRNSLAKVRLRVRSSLARGTFIRDDYGATEWTRARADAHTPGPWEEEHLERYRISRERASALAGFEDDIDAVTLPGFAPGDVVDVPLVPLQNGRLLINHIGSMEAFDVVSALDVLEGRVDGERIRGRIALVGVTAIGTWDQRVTPFDSVLPGVFAHAAIMDSMITGRHLRRPSWSLPVELAMLILIGVVVGLLMPRLSRARSIGLFVASGLLIIALSTILPFLWFHVQLAAFTPIFLFASLSSTVAMLQWVAADREKRHVRRVFQHYLAPSVLKAVLEDPKKLGLQPEKAELTVLFSDIRGFTKISESLSPEELATMLNSYLSPMTSVIFQHLGTLDKYMGDAIMAFWNDPVPQEEHALMACRAALSMRDTCLELNHAFSQRGWPQVRIGVGINTGVMTVGNFGSDVLFDYTVMGDAVNLASRLEGVNKQYGTTIILGEGTYEKVAEHVVARELDSVRVKGKTRPVRIFELVAIGEPTEADRELTTMFGRGLALYKEQRWEEAKQVFSRCAAARPDDRPSQVYIERCKEMSESPPGDDWDGVYTMQGK